MKRALLILLAAALLLGLPVCAVETLYDDDITLIAPSAILMEQSTGSVLYEKNAYEHLAPASVTKVMTMLLIVEAVEDGVISLDEMVTASARAASMGGSQVWLAEGERMSVSEMLKCVAVVSANDCCVALAEHLSGSEEAFVAKMNARAAELGMADTHFLSCSGLSDSDAHYTCARDIAVMSRELMRHELVKQYTTIWMDSIRDGEFGLSNTNKLIYYYPGATGLKTGFTSRAMYCLSATAERDGTAYIAVVLHAPTSSDRFESAKALLNHAFANYTLISPDGQVAIPPVEVLLGETGIVQPVLPEGASVLVEKGGAGKIEYVCELPERVEAPVEAGEALGSVSMYAGGALVQRIPLVSPERIEKLSVWRMFLRMIEALVCD